MIHAGTTHTVICIQSNCTVRLPWGYTTQILQGILVPKLTLGPFLTLSARNRPNLQSYLFQMAKIIN